MPQGNPPKFASAGPAHKMPYAPGVDDFVGKHLALIFSAEGRKRRARCYSSSPIHEDMLDVLFTTRPQRGLREPGALTRCAPRQAIHHCLRMTSLASPRRVDGVALRPAPAPPPQRGCSYRHRRVALSYTLAETCCCSGSVHGPRPHPSGQAAHIHIVEWLPREYRRQDVVDIGNGAGGCYDGASTGQNRWPSRSEPGALAMGHKWRSPMLSSKMGRCSCRSAQLCKLHHSNGFDSFG